MAEGPSAIGFDADDTLWHNERFFRLSQDQFTNLLADHADPDHLGARLLAAEKRNIGRYGFGIKGFTLSMIETAIEVTESRVPSATIRQILELGREMLAHPIELLPHARAAVEHAADRMPVILITKGDLLDQERKLAQSGLGDLFAAVEIVSDKTPGRYDDIFARHADGPTRSVMVGNSMKSDIVPMIEAGGWAVHVPHDLAWALEHAVAPSQAPRFREIPDLGALPALLEDLARVD